jgi:hypothetical protein
MKKKKKKGNKNKLYMNLFETDTLFHVIFTSFHSFMVREAQMLSLAEYIYTKAALL